MILLFTQVWAQDPPPPIVGGSETSAYTEVGAIVAIHPQGYGASFCSATLIHRYWVLTAAHCIYGDDAAQDMSDQGYDIFFVTARDVYSASYNDFHEIHPQKMIPHPYYDGYDIEHDIGLMQLSYPIDNKEPVPLSASYTQFTNKDITYVGYGITGDGREDSGVRRTTDVPYWTYDSMFLYTLDPYGEKNICSGDSGGAALVENSSGYIIVGVNSFGFDVNGGPPTCEGPDAAAGATRVDQYLDFIQDNVGDIITDGGGSGSGGSGSGGSGSGGSGSGGSGSGGTAITQWEPPLSTTNYEESDIPAPAAGCSSVSSRSGWWTLILGVLFVRQGRRKS